ncbi:tyrosine-type recombinase/integrase [Sphaerisporangium sp. TRM90804]|nr:tyrosine-type recombinase/integrase [Sphaerisporangium sp. TRM90804]MDH2425612.1 tyrosine-type recombinase/integrase [Sphaerisporangium sp. TRM90804]
MARTTTSPNHARGHSRRTTAVRSRERNQAKALAKAGLPKIHFHDLRHTGNTLAANAGASIRELMDRMGHSSTRAAMVYQHGSHERQREVASKLDALARDQLTKASGGHGSRNRPVETRNPGRDVCPDLGFLWVEPRRFELLTSCLQRRLPILLALRRHSSAR